MNFWLIYGSPPTDGLESEIVIKDFQFLTGVSHQAGDIDGDMDVNIADLASISENFQDTNCDAFNNWCDRKDLDCNGSIGVGDALAFTQYWLESWD